MKTGEPKDNKDKPSSILAGLRICILSKIEIVVSDGVGPPPS